LSARDRVLEALADAVVRVSRPHPVRVGVDGRSAAGKSTLCGELAAAVAARGRPVLRASIDDFHRPGHTHRSRRREWTPETLYGEGYDYRAFADLVLRPLGPGGDRRCRQRLWDAANDVAYPEEWHELPRDGVLVAEASFLFRPELALHFDVTLWLDIDFETLLQRVRRRDVAWVGSEEEVVAKYRSTWIPVHALYEEHMQPRDRADIVVDNSRFDEPRVVRMSLR
jgi:uridine kinase